ncbi:MAG: hypothetical protein JJD98_12330 [Polaromonas sp.]|nr:hypothetical protein [Polaromonas sp.]
MRNHFAAFDLEIAKAHGLTGLRKWMEPAIGKHVHILGLHKTCIVNMSYGQINPLTPAVIMGYAVLAFGEASEWIARQLVFNCAS